MAFKQPKANPTRECLPLVIQLMPYYAQYNELIILRELHAKLGDLGKQLHQRMLTDAILHEQSAIRAVTLGLQQQIAEKEQQNLVWQQFGTRNGADNLLGGMAISTNQQQQQNCAREGERRSGMEMEEAGRTEEDVVIVEEEERGTGRDTAGIGLARVVARPNNQVNPNDPLEKRRADFLREASTLYNNKYRMLSRSVYEFYIKRLKITQNLDPRLLLKKDLEIRNKFELAVFMEDGLPVERLVERGKERRKLVAIEEVFDVVHLFHERVGHGKRMAIYDSIKRQYANITLNCVLLYMAGCQGCYSNGGEPAQMDNCQNGQSNDASGHFSESPQSLRARCSPQEKTVESRAAKLGLDEIDYSEHFVIGEDEIRCRHCHFVYFHKSRQRPRHSLRSHLRNYHRKLFNQMMEQNGEVADKFGTE